MQDSIDVDVQAELMRQEHRIIPLIKNAWAYSSALESDPRRDAVRSALVFRAVMALLPIGAAVGVGIIGLLGLFLSWRTTELEARANELSETQVNLEARANALAEREDTDQRRVILKSIASAEGMAIEPINPSQGINNVSVYFPSKLKIPHEVLIPPNFDIPNEEWAVQVKAYLDSKIAAQEGAIVGSQHYPIQAMFLTQGHAGGRTTITAAVYDCFFTYWKTEDGSSSAKLRSIAFANYFLNEGDPQKLIDELFGEVETRVMKHNSDKGK